MQNLQKSNNMPYTSSKPSTKQLDLYEGFTNQITGETFTVLYHTPESITFRWSVQPHGYVPFEHIHLNQDEIFQIRKGKARMVINGKETVAHPGDIVRIKKGMPHIIFNDQSEVLDCFVSFEPALDSFKFFQCFGGLTVDNDMDKRGKINISKMLYFTKRMNARCITRPTEVPSMLFGIALKVCYQAGKLLGWEKNFIRYTSSPITSRSKSIL
jgi:mannose-6-phosphate isomerase-like protein (cupin superfamily)